MTLPLPTIAARLTTVGGMSFPRSIEKIDQLIGSGEAPNQVIAAVIASDPMLSALVLGNANAVAHGDITNISAAVAQVGLAAVRGLTRATRPIPEARRKEAAACWGLANATATMTRILANHCAPHLAAKVDEETAHTAGLLHDLGTIVAILHFDADYAAALDRNDVEGPLSRVLRKGLGADTCDLGALLAKAWHLPMPIATCIRYYNSPMRAEAYTELVCLVHVARTLVRALGFTAGRDRFVDPIAEDALKVLNLFSADLELVIDLFFEEMDELELYEGALSRS